MYATYVVGNTTPKLVFLKQALSRARLGKRCPKISNVLYAV